MTDTRYTRAFTTTIQGTQLENGRRQLTGRLVPYNVAATVVDLSPDGNHDVYQEGFRRGAFTPQVTTPERGVVMKIGLVHRHDGGLGYLGPFTALRDEGDGLYGSAIVLPTRADDVEALLEAGVNQLSVEFRLPGRHNTDVDDNGVRWRTAAHLDQVALEPKGAYSQAEVLQYREDQEAVIREAEAQAAHDAEEAAQVEEAARAAEERRLRWEQMTGRIDSLEAAQQEMIERYGVMKPGGYVRLG